MNHIVQIDEVARLFSIAEDDGWFSSDHLCDEPGNYAGIAGIRRLERAKHIEVAQADAFYTVNPVETVGIIFTRKLLDSVRGNRIRQHFFQLGLDVFFSIDGT